MPDPLVLVPGMVSDARAFWHQVIALSSGRAVQVAAPVRGVSVEEMAADLLEQAPAEFALAGQGLGGNVALEMQRRAPERVTRVALIATNAQAEPSAESVAREPRIVGAQAGRLTEMVAKEFPECVLAPGRARDEILDMLRDMALTLGEGVYIRQSRAMQRRPDQQKVLRRAMLPALVIGGSDDPVIPPRRHRFMAELMPHGTFVEIGHCGHLPSLEQPEAVTDALEDWLQAPLMLR